AGRLDAAGRGGRVRDPLQARAGGPARAVRGHLRRPLRRSVRRALPFLPPPRPLLGAAGRVEVEGLHLHLRGAGRRARAPGADHPRARRDLPAALQHRAGRPVLEGRKDRRGFPGAPNPPPPPPPPQRAPRAPPPPPPRTPRRPAPKWRGPKPPGPKARGPRTLNGGAPARPPPGTGVLSTAVKRAAYRYCFAAKPTASSRRDRRVPEAGR